MNKYTFLIFVALGFLATGTVNAQKFGYINAQQIIQSIPQVKEANSELESMQKQLEKQGQDRIVALQTKYQALERKQAQGEISPKQLEVEAQSLKQEELNIAKFQQDAQDKLRAKSESLLKPIRDAIQKAIDDVAVAEGYSYIFDESMGIILYADKSSDVSDKVRAKIVIK